jgi:hypothetical protein
MFIYLIVNHITGKYYVGQHKGNNLKKYFQQKLGHAKRGESKRSYLYNSMRKHPDPSIWSIHALLSDIQTKPELDQHERNFIAFLKSQDPEYGYNICRGGEGFTGPHTEQWKEEARARMTGRTFSSEAIAKMRAAPKTEAQLANLSLGTKALKFGMSHEDFIRSRVQPFSAQAWKGNHHTTETRLRLSENHRGTANPMYGMAWFYNDLLQVIKRFKAESAPDGWVRGRKFWR